MHAARTTLLLALVLTGCAAEPEVFQLDDFETEADLNELSTTRSSTAAGVLPADAGPEAYVRLALESHPRLIAARARVRQREAGVAQARAIDDPMFMVTPFGEMAETAAGPVETMLGLSQTIPLPQKLSARAETARGQTLAAMAELRAMRQEIASETRRAFWAYWLADRRLRVTEESRDLLGDVLETARAQLRAGRADQADVLRTSTELAGLQNELIDLQQDKQLAAATLNRLLDRPVTAPLPEPPDIEPQTVDVDLDTLLIEAADSNPALTARAAELSAARSQLRLARLDYLPDLGLSANYAFVGEEGLAIMANGQDQWSLGFSVNIPLWQGKRRAREREARAAIAEQMALLSAQQNDVAFDVQEAVLEVRSQERLLRLFRDEVLPQARQVVDATAAAYRAGEADALAYLEAWRRLLDFGLAEQTAVAGLGIAQAELKQALGREDETDSEVMP